MVLRTAGVREFIWVDDFACTVKSLVPCVKADLYLCGTHCRTVAVKTTKTEVLYNSYEKKIFCHLLKLKQSSYML